VVYWNWRWDRNLIKAGAYNKKFFFVSGIGWALMQ